VVLLTIFWVLHFVVAALEKPYFFAFLYNLGSSLLLPLLFFGWWFFNRRLSLADRLYGFALVVGGALIVKPLCHESLGGWIGLLMGGLGIVLTSWTIGLVVLKRMQLPYYRLASFLIIALAWGQNALVRMDGLDGDLQSAVRWRWAPSAERLFLEEQAKRANSETVATAPPLTAKPEDWVEFRGKDRAGVAYGTHIGIEWAKAPPKQVWRHRVGPAWSSVIVVGDRLFTQEQRGEKEAVVCYDASTGQELWAHEDADRFFESVSGPGPRATPTFADGNIYTLGARGLLNRLDAATGKLRWSHRITDETGTDAIPQWGYSGSPLVIDGLVIAFGGGKSDKNLLAYRVADGSLAWGVPAGGSSYSSPQSTAIAGQRQCLILSDAGLTAVEPATGNLLWKDGVNWPGAPRCVQPHLVEGNRLLVGTLDGGGVSLIDVNQANGAWSVVKRWASVDLKPEFPDIVVHGGHVYGFDDGNFCCIDLEKGERCWKKGRYGRGQVILLADQSYLLVLSEKGEVVLLSATPEKQVELARFQALNGKTWAPPVVVRGRLYVRNAEEMACYELPGQ
jgi:outer membrane protein assembly factor BamB